MAKKKAVGSGASEPDARGFAVVLEDIRAQFGLFGEALQGLREHMEARFEAVDRRFDAVERKFDAVEGKFDAVDSKFDAVDRRFDRMDYELGLVKTAVLENSRELKKHARALLEQSSR